MEEAEFQSLDEETQRQLAVAYLLKNKEEVPDGLGNLFKKLAELESSAFSIMMAIKEAKRTISSLSPRSDQIAGAMTAIADLISEELTEDQIMSYGLKYESRSDKTQEPDIAGSTAKTYNNENPIPANSGA